MSVRKVQKKVMVRMAMEELHWLVVEQLKEVIRVVQQELGRWNLEEGVLSCSPMNPIIRRRRGVPNESESCPSRATQQPGTSWESSKPDAEAVMTLYARPTVSWSVRSVRGNFR